MTELTEQDNKKHKEQTHGHAGAPSTKVSGRSALLFLLVMLIVAVIICGAGIILRVKARTTVKDQTDAGAAPDVTAAKPQTGSPEQEVVVPGNMYAYTDSPIYARTSGYLDKWYYDIGAHVKKGALLATISSPEVDQQLLQAKANLATAQANAGYAATTATRYQNLLKSDAVSQQDTENFSTQAKSSNTAVQAALASVQQYEALTSFEKVYAPFSGVITSRAIDVGQLIDSGANRELFHMAKTDVLRVYINVPQVSMRSAVKGVKATLDLVEYPGQPFTGTIVRTADAIDPASRWQTGSGCLHRGPHQGGPDGSDAHSSGRHAHLSVERSAGRYGGAWFRRGPREDGEYRARTRRWQDRASSQRAGCECAGDQ
jgi:multidrug efflux pump subunit AcrA (membrane-fusion protein)